MRILPLLCLLLSACSSGVWTDTSLPLPTAPASLAGPPSQDDIQKSIPKVVAEAKLTKRVEISGLRKVDHGPGDYFLCLREVTAPPDQPRRTYSVFFNALYAGSRL